MARALSKYCFVFCPKLRRRVDVAEECEPECDFYEDQDDLCLYCNYPKEK